jgi:hypothetical protein
LITKIMIHLVTSDPCNKHHNNHKDEIGNILAKTVSLRKD